MSEKHDLLEHYPLEALLVKLNFDLEDLSGYPEIFVFGLRDLGRCRLARQKIVDFVHERLAGFDDFKIQFSIFEDVAVLVFAAMRKTGLGDEMSAIVEDTNMEKLYFAVEGSGRDLDLGYVKAMEIVESLGTETIGQLLENEEPEIGDIREHGYATGFAIPEKKIDRVKLTIRASVMSFVATALGLALFFAAFVFTLQIAIALAILIFIGWVALDIWTLMITRRGGR